MPEFEIREFTDSDLPALATHWKESIKGWPPGFSPSGDWSPEGVREWLFKESHIAVWLGWVGDVVVSYLGYSQGYTDTDCTYVGLLNAHPGYQGKGYGRKILAHCVDRAIHDNVKRLDLYTWPGNLQAVPLYKKTGFFWRPDSDVMMYNFLPVAVNNPLVKSFLGDVNWYDALRQPLEVKEDTDLHDGCHYHKYTFAADNKNLEVLVDPSTSGIAGITTPEFSVKALIRGDSHPSGFSHPVTWVVENKNSTALDIKLHSSQSGVVDYSLNESLALSGRKEIETNVKVASDAQREHQKWYSKPLECRVTVNGVESIIKPGIHAVPSIELRRKDTVVYLNPGDSSTENITLNSNIPDEISFTPEITSTGPVSVDNSQDSPIEIQPNDSFGIGVHAESSGETGKGIISIGGKLSWKGETSEIHPVILGACSYPTGKASTLSPNDPEYRTISNGLLTVTSRRRGGSTDFMLRSDGKLFNQEYEAIGKPFSSEFATALYSIDTGEDEFYAWITLSCASNDFPGLEIRRKIKLGSGYEVHIETSLINNSGREFKGKVCVNFRMQNLTRPVMPLNGRIVYGDRESWHGGNVSVPSDPSRFSENWFAYNVATLNTNADKFVGFIFSNVDKLNFNRWGVFAPEFHIGKLPPGATHEFPWMKIIGSAASWEEIQNIALKNKPSSLPRRAVHYIRAESNVFPGENPAINFHMERENECTGTGTVIMENGNRIEESSGTWNINSPIRIDLPVNQDTPGLKKAVCETKWMGITRTDQLAWFDPVPGSSVKIESSAEKDMEFMAVDNGAIEFRVAPAFCGTLYHLSDLSNGRNLLRTSFPEPASYVWWNPWYGGIGIDAYSLGYRFHRSKFKGSGAKINWHGIEWEGIKVDITLLRDFSSVKIEIYFLTRPGVHAILNLTRIFENGNASRNVNTETWMFPDLTGDIDLPTENLLDIDGGKIHLRRSEDGQSTGHGNWVAHSDPRDGKTLGVVCLQGKCGAYDIARDGQAIFMGRTTRSYPDQIAESATFITLADSPDKIPVLANSILHWDRKIVVEKSVAYTTGA